MGPYLAKPITQKTIFHAENHNAKLRFSRCEMQGWRRTMQDAAISQLELDINNSIFAVFDGHGGPEVAKFVQGVFVGQLKSSKYYKEKKYEDALIDTFRRLDQLIESEEGEENLKAIRSNSETNFNDKVVGAGTGCTACVVLITPTRIITANAGDSRAVLSRKGNALPLSFDHKPTDESQRRRIMAAGGEIINGRINGSLNLSRSLGDLNFKKQRNRGHDQQLVICRPDVTDIPRVPGEDQFIIIGCDGVWEKYVKDSQQMVDRLKELKKSNPEGKAVVENLLNSLVAKSTEEEKGCDNMTAILVQFL